jgi:hypothetical protein
MMPEKEQSLRLAESEQSPRRPSACVAQSGKQSHHEASFTKFYCQQKWAYVFFFFINTIS